MSDKVPRDRPSLADLLAIVPDAPLPPESSEERAVLAQKKVGTKIKGWRLVRLLGVGPITASYEAYLGDGDAGDHGTLKLMIGAVAANERARALFLRSAYAANRFRHPRVLEVRLDGTEPSGAPFILRTWEDTKSLEQSVEAHGLNDQQVLRVAEQVLDALEIAHAHGVVHGAVSPQNILVTARGSMRLCDFSTPPGAAAHGNADGDLLGTLRIGPYSAPEQCASPPLPVGDGADIYSLAACMYYAVTKSAPRGKARTREELAKAVARPIRELAPNVGEGLAAIIDHALSVDAAHRYESAYAMLGDVRRAMAGRSPKLNDARRPVPSGSYRDLSAADTASSRRMLRSELPKPILTTGAVRTKQAQEWKGNVMLILAIALLVGIATFVVVREKLEDQRNPPSETP
jgi:serine/threonine protein kinase